MKELSDYSDFDRLYDDWKQLRGRAESFSEWSHIRVLNAIKKGRKHATLGLNLDESKNWFDHGLNEFKYILEASKIQENQIVCDFGCGSLRVGKHFIARQHTSCYIGIDQIKGFIDIAKSKLAKLIDSKQPLLGSITESMNEVVKLNVFLLFSVSVMRHVPPQEHALFFKRIDKILHRAGSLAVLDVHVSLEPLRFSRSGWAWPIDYYCKKMVNFDLIRNESEPQNDETVTRGTTRHLLTFVRRQS